MRRVLSKPMITALIAFLLGHAFMEYLGFSKIIHGIYVIAFVGLFAKTTSTQNSVFVFRAIVPIVIGLGLVCLYRFLYQIPSAAVFLSASSAENTFYLERLFESLSTLYAVCTAFLLWKGLDDHDKLKQVLKDESSQIQSMLGFLNYLKEEHNRQYSTEIREGLKLYIERIIQDNVVKTHKDNYALLSDIRTSVSLMETSNSKSDLALAEIMKGLNNLFQIRTRRIGYMEARISPYILIALGFMSLSILYVTFTSEPSDTVVVDMIIFILGALQSFMLMMLIDIGSPFAGYWSIKLESFDKIVDILDRESKK